MLRNVCVAGAVMEEESLAKESSSASPWQPISTPQTGQSLVIVTGTSIQ